MKELYDNFVCDFEHRINPLALMEIAMYCLLDMQGNLLLHVTLWRKSRNCEAVCCLH